MSQLPFGWVCFSNPSGEEQIHFPTPSLNCLSAGSVSLTAAVRQYGMEIAGLNCLSAGSVSLTERVRPFAEKFVAVSIAFRLGLFL